MKSMLGSQKRFEYADYILQDLQLFDEDGDSHCQPSQHNIPAAKFELLSMPDDCESS